MLWENKQKATRFQICPPLGHRAVNRIHRENRTKQNSTSLPETVMKSRKKKKNNKEYGIISIVQCTDFFSRVADGR